MACLAKRIEHAHVMRRLEALRPTPRDMLDVEAVRDSGTRSGAMTDCAAFPSAGSLLATTPGCGDGFARHAVVELRDDLGGGELVDVAHHEERVGIDPPVAHHICVADRCVVTADDLLAVVSTVGGPNPTQRSRCTCGGRRAWRCSSMWRRPPWRILCRKRANATEAKKSGLATPRSKTQTPIDKFVSGVLQLKEADFEKIRSQPKGKTSTMVSGILRSPAHAGPSQDGELQVRWPLKGGDRHGRRKTCVCDDEHEALEHGAVRRDEPIVVGASDILHPWRPESSWRSCSSSARIAMRADVVAMKMRIDSTDAL